MCFILLPEVEVNGNAKESFKFFILKEEEGNIWVLRYN